jgi:hypothetical protein
MVRMLSIAALGLATLAASAQQREEIPRGNRQTLRGTLVDAGCKDRSLWNLHRPPETVANAIPSGQQPAPANQNQNVQSHGVTVDSKTIEAERKDILPVMNPDLASRQPDPTCSVKAGTRAYALLMDNGRLIDLDEGGNTYASLAVQNSSAGRAMINAKGPGFKPRVTVMGTLEGDRVFVDDLNLNR